MTLPEILKDITRNMHLLRDEAQRRDAIPDLMQGMAELAMHFADQPADRDSNVVQKFVAGTADTYKSSAAHIDLVFGNALETLLNSAFEADEWQTVCRRRSAMETVNELYGEAVGEDFMLDAEDIDEMLRDKAEEEAAPAEDQRAMGTPESHWWWRLG